MIKSLNDRVCVGTTRNKKTARGLERAVQPWRQNMQVKARFHGGSHLCGVKEHGGGLLREVSLTIGGGEAPTVHGR